LDMIRVTSSPTTGIPWTEVAGSPQVRI
jgi:hypothetical protein